MKRTIYSLLLLLFCACSQSDIKGQATTPFTGKYNLLTMPYNQRPLLLYKGQLRFDAGYKFAVRAQSYSSEGDLINLKSNGTGSVYHYYFIRVRYGVLNFIELGSETNLLKRGIRDATTTVVSVTPTSTESITVNKLTETKGMGDILLYASVRMPVEYRWFDLSIKGGIFLPSAKYKTPLPTNKIEIAQLNSSTINLHYNYANGYGVPVYLISSSAKLNYKKFTLEAEWTMHTPVKEGQNIRWEETLTNDSFSYADNTYSYLLSNTYTLNTSLHYQATGWFNFYLNSSFLRTKNGWTEYWGNRYENPEKRLVNLEPGFELQISPSLTVYQMAGFPIKGKNNDAPFYIFTTLSYKLFPFMR